MKTFLTSLLLFASFQVFATESKNQVVVACSNDNKNYNAKFYFERNKMTAYAISEIGWSDIIHLSKEEAESKEVWIEYAMVNDTNFGYVIYQGNDLIKDWRVKGWTSGNDSDNYEASINDDQITCHLLLKDPKSTLINVKNIFKKL